MLSLRVIFLLCCTAGSLAHADEFAADFDLNLTTAVDGWVRERSISRMGTGYGLGGYGDAGSVGYSLNVCSSKQVDQTNCSVDNPDGDQLFWRFIHGIGWRKFTRYGAAQKDWADYKKTLPWRSFAWQLFNNPSRW